ncbi:MAG: HAD family hydrolase, partial [Lachnospiraceae bacterium]|nr:HAD family hydrolase [Lachnospiraceae bacterium]
IILDVDGTLWDSTAEVARSWRKTCGRLGVPSSHITPERLKNEFGKTLEDIGFSLFPDLPKEEAIRITREACDDENAYLMKDHPSVYEGVQELMRELKARGIPVYIVSNCQSGYIEVLTAVSGLAPYVADHLCAGDTGVPKAETLRIAVKKWGLKSPVYVGDTAGDEKSAGEAGIPFIHASYGFGTAANPVAVIDGPMGLLELV